MLAHAYKYLKHFLIAQDGSLWDATGWQIRLYLDFFGGNLDLSILCVRKLQFALLSYGQNSVRIRLRAGSLSHAAFETLLKLLLSREMQRYVIEFYTEAEAVAEPFAAQVFADVEEVAAYLDAARGQTPGELARRSFLSEELDLRHLVADHQRELRKALALWRRVKGEISPKKMASLLSKPFEAPMLLTRRDGNSDRIVPETWPSYITIIDAETLPLVPGRCFEDIPHRGTYIVDAAQGFRSVMRTGEPTLDLVDAALIQADGSIRRVRYERLCLPWRGPGGEIFASTISAFRSKRNLPPTPTS